VLRSLTTICETLAASGFAVRGIGSTAGEGGAAADPLALLLSIGIRPQKDSARTAGRVRPELRYTHRGVAYHLLDVALRDFRPDILVFGLRNEGYLTSDFFDHTIDAVLTPSQFLSDLPPRSGSIVPRPPRPSNLPTWWPKITTRSCSP
jgi:hypothetical protein